MSAALLGAALLAALAVVLALSAGRSGPVRRPAWSGQGSASGMPPPGEARAGSWRVLGTRTPDGVGPATVRAVGALAGVAVWLLLGGVVGAVLGMATAIVLPAVFARMEPVRVRRERLELVRTAPLVADLLAASLMAGVPLEYAVPVVARAVGGAAGGALMGVHRRTELGESAGRAWSGLGQVPGLGGVARAVARSSRTGAPLAGLLAQSADDLRCDPAAAALAEVRATSVRAVLPLGLCLLPAFALLGIAPIVGGLIPSL